MMLKDIDGLTDKIVVPFASIVLQDVYYIKTHSKDYTTVEGGINLKVLIKSIRMFRMIPFLLLLE